MERLLSSLLIILSLGVSGQNWEFVNKNDLDQEITAVDVSVLGIVYVGTERGNIYSFYANGSPENFYSSEVFEPVTTIDASNALRTLVYFQSTGEIEMIERFSAQARTYQVDDFGTNNATDVKIAQDGTLWFLIDRKLVQVNQQTGLLMNEKSLEEWKILDSIESVEIYPKTIVQTEKEVIFWQSDMINYIPALNYFLEDDYIWLLEAKGITQWNLNKLSISNLKLPLSGVTQFVKFGEYFHFIKDSRIYVYKKKKA